MADLVRENTTGTTTVAIDWRRRLLLGVEYVALFFGAVSLYALLDRPGSPIPVLVLLAVVAVVYLRRQPAFDRRSLTRGAAVTTELRPMLLLWALASVAMAVVLAVASPERLLQLPREQPLLWGVIVVFYPLLSVYPQELIFRGFLFQRYAPLFGTGRAMVAASAGAFGFAHVIFGNWLSVVLTIVGGWLFATRYQRSQSLIAASVEHALYGVLVFTVGLGDFFYHGAVHR
ncbi:CPBP family intramembrane glutamic endopeptidase [Streptoalloteichus hindustanus]|uniref:CAAX protease self-immunity n=1 Tax=Streptoalloteichus hindustanus TaxID=2017 RepID=A0A1M4XLQ5_STRHI|nr:CPBP family intramembrane glutamic endopeptidase [Streptoalloteichus hindustanus]SHE94504.1 CAAX protease self-immunity [Streptoalloteichus hindustanus]